MTLSRQSGTSGDPFANPGSRSAGWLREAGFQSLAEVQAVGSVEAYRRTKALHPRSVSLNLLWALEAALLGI
jgi:DNA transformation protein